MEEKTDQFDLEDLDNLNFDDLAGNSGKKSSNNVSYGFEEYESSRINANMFTVLSAFFAFLTLFSFVLNIGIIPIFPLLFISFLILCKNLNFFTLPKIAETIVLFVCALLYIIIAFGAGASDIIKLHSIVFGITILVISVLKIISNYIALQTIFKWVNFAIYIISALTALLIFVNKYDLSIIFDYYYYASSTIMMTCISPLLALAFSELAQKDI